MIWWLLEVVAVLNLGWSVVNYLEGRRQDREIRELSGRVERLQLLADSAGASFTVERYGSTFRLDEDGWHVTEPEQVPGSDGEVEQEEKGSSFWCWLGFHAERDQRAVGYCKRCGHFKRTNVVGGIWERYVLPPKGDPPRGGPPRPEPDKLTGPRRW